MDRLDVLKEAADQLAEFNIRGALDSLKKTFREPIEAFKKGYRKGRGLPDEDPKEEPKAEPEVHGPKHEPERDEPKDDPVDVEVHATTPEEKKRAKKKEAEKKARERKSAEGCTTAPRAKNKMRCPKPGGGHVYYSRDEFKRLRAQIKQKTGGRKKK